MSSSKTCIPELERLPASCLPAVRASLARDHGSDPISGCEAASKEARQFMEILLEDIRAGPGPRRFRAQLRLVILRDDGHAGFRKSDFDQPGCLETVHRFHPPIHQRPIGPFGGADGDRFLTAAGLADRLGEPSNRLFDQFPHARIVVGDQEFQLANAPLPAGGATLSMRLRRRRTPCATTSREGSPRATPAGSTADPLGKEFGTLRVHCRRRRGPWEFV